MGNAQLKNRQVDGRVQAETTLVRAEGRVELRAGAREGDRAKGGGGYLELAGLSRGAAVAAETGGQDTHLDPETALDVALSLVILPKNAELDDALGDLNNLKRFLVLGVLLEELEG